MCKEYSKNSKILLWTYYKLIDFLVEADKKQQIHLFKEPLKVHIKVEMC